VRKLEPHAESSQALQALLDQLASGKQLSDERYAEGRARALSRKYGTARVRHDLRSKGVSDEIIQSISSEGELERAKAILARKYREPAATAEERARRARFLQSRGFPMELIARLLRGGEEFA
ncbi:MAG TPA: regulatory protein RecX, partial [Burkholderiales bacterium]|nr:regulatory protein RecX [Burkholderiales bacterium]